MSTVIFTGSGVSVTTHGSDTNGQQRWLARRGDSVVEFTAARDSDHSFLYIAAAVLLRIPLDANAADFLMDPA